MADVGHDQRTLYIHFGVSQSLLSTTRFTNEVSAVAIVSLSALQRVRAYLSASRSGSWRPDSSEAYWLA